MSFRPPDTPDPFAPRFMEIATLMRMPLARQPADADIGLVGVPYDGALTNRPGARHGPREIRNQSSLVRAINHATGVRPFEMARVRDMGDVPFERILDIEAAHGDIRARFDALVDAGVATLAFGGDHSVTLPILRAVARRPLALIHIDAHTDTWDSFQGSKFTHGAPFRRAVEEGLIDPRRTVQIGIRGTQNLPEGWDYSRDAGMRVVFVEELHERGPAAIAAEAKALVGDHPAYLSFDIDSLDPAFAPGTGTPEIGGLSSWQAQALLRGLRGVDIVGADVVEVSPPFDVGGLTAMAGAMLGFEILCLMTEAWAARHGED